ncbi:MAG: serine/threonine-protein kinase [Candidatus Zixiibacteriota bacterium]
MSAASIPIGPYRGVAVGHGGFAGVYQVADVSGRPRALKWADASADPALTTALEREYEILSQLVFPQLPRAWDFGVAEGRPYMVNDWIGGPLLWDRFTSPTADDFVHVLREMSTVLLFLHRRGWVHGDLKPDNFRWRPPQPSHVASEISDTLCLLDFGLARPVGDPGRPRGAGTVGYCAPEFLKCEPADGRADWYAVGAILYEWTYGRRPFASSETAMEVAGHLETAPEFSLPQVKPAPEWAQTVLARLLAKNPNERGRDDLDLLRWLAEYDPALELEALLNSQLPWHLRSEECRWDDQERQFVEQLVDEAEARHQIHWAVWGCGDTAPRLPRQLAFALSRRGWSVRCVPGADAADSSADAVPVEATIDDCGVTRRVECHWSPVPQPDVTDPPASDTTRAVDFLPWDVQRVREFLTRLTGDEDFAARTAATVAGATGGIPTAVSALIRCLIAQGDLRLSQGDWNLNESGVISWAATDDAAALFRSVTGDLTDAEARLIDWLALGRSCGHLTILNDLWDRPGDDLLSVVDRLALRGLIICQNLAPEEPCFDVRLRFPGWDVVRRAGMSAGERARDSLALAEAIEARRLRPDLLRESVLADCCADGGDWSNAARHALAAAVLEIDDDQRDAARRHIVAAELAAQRIDEPSLRTHWQGRARMVQGDLEKASGHLDVAHRLYREILVLGRKNGDLRLLAETLKDLGDLYRITRRFEKGVRALRRARRLWEEVGDRLELARTLTNIGNMYWVAADMASAQQYYQEALAIQRQEPGGETFAAVILTNLGAVNLVQYAYTEAEAHFREAFSIHQRLNDPVEMARSLNNLGALFFMQGWLEDAASLFEAAAEHNRGADAKSEELFNRRNLIEVALERGDLRHAVTLGVAVLERADDLGDIATGAEVAALLAEAHLRAGDFRTAQTYVARGEQALESIKNDDLRIGLALVAASRRHRLGDQRGALAVLDAVVPRGTSLANGHLHVDCLILRLSAAVAMRDESAGALWQEGRAAAERVGAPHKAAHLAFARLAEHSTGGVDDAARRHVEEFLDRSPRWHWAAAFQVWRAQWQARQGDAHAALSTVSRAIAQLRRDGNWDTLWRALVVQGHLLHDQADYEPALRSLNEAARILKAITQTIDSTGDHAQYEGQPLACMLSETARRIRELVAC